jgi:hypothetical protein
VFSFIFPLISVCTLFDISDLISAPPPDNATAPPPATAAGIALTPLISDLLSSAPAYRLRFAEIVLVIFEFIITFITFYYYKSKIAI